jgi:hypothetical protein
MSDNNDHGAPGRSLLAEMTTLRREMEDIRKGIGMLCDLQKELALKVEAALTMSPITDGETPAQVV